MHTYSIFENGKPLKEAGKALILLHGRGGTAENIMQLAAEFCDDNFYIAAPRATNNTWYPLSFLAPEELNQPWLSSAVDIVKRLIDETAKYIPHSNIYLLGFSQGACLALETAERIPAPYAGVVAFTGGLIGEVIDPAKYKGRLDGAKVFIGNSDTDPHVPRERSEESGRLMEESGANVKVKIYPGMPHTIISDEIETVKKFMF